MGVLISVLASCSGVPTIDNNEVLDDDRELSAEKYISMVSDKDKDHFISQMYIGLSQYK